MVRGDLAGSDQAELLLLAATRCPTEKRATGWPPYPGSAVAGRDAALLTACRRWLAPARRPWHVLRQIGDLPLAGIPGCAAAALRPAACHLSTTCAARPNAKGWICGSWAATWTWRAAQAPRNWRPATSCWAHCWPGFASAGDLELLFQATVYPAPVALEGLISPAGTGPPDGRHNGGSGAAGAERLAASSLLTPRETGTSSLRRLDFEALRQHSQGKTPSGRRCGKPAVPAVACGQRLAALADGIEGVHPVHNSRA